MAFLSYNIEHFYLHAKNIDPIDLHDKESKSAILPAKLLSLPLNSSLLPATMINTSKAPIAKPITDRNTFIFFNIDGIDRSGKYLVKTCRLK